MAQCRMMRVLDLTLPTPAENLALDEALLDEAEAAGRPTETLRFWEPSQTMVVVGRSSDVAGEVRLEACRELGVPVLRRASGGAAIVTGRGCLMYGLVLSLRRRPHLRGVDRAHRDVLGKLAESLSSLHADVRCAGTSDLALGDRKFSGNSLRMKRDHLVYHGTLLYDFRLEQIGRLLAMPPRQPGYRDGRAHGAFVANLPVSAEAIRRVIAAAWEAHAPRETWPADRTARLVEAKYGRAEWNRAAGEGGSGRSGDPA
jgi:lipoate-protein ligase A